MKPLRALVGLLAATLLCALPGCDRTPAPSNRATSTRSAATAEPPSKSSVQVVDTSAFEVKTEGRVLAFGDVHGDFAATQRLLRFAKVIDEKDHWIGGDVTVVQTGDQLDRGDTEREILDLFKRLEKDAEAAGGHFITLNGNHETMNVAGDFRYVTEGGFAAFSEVVQPVLPADVKARLPVAAVGRARAFFPGGSFAELLSQRRVIVKVNDSVFVHGGVRNASVDYGIERINQQTRDWMLGRKPVPKPIVDPEGPVWTRYYSNPEVPAVACKELGKVLARLGAKRMVVGHTTQKDGITHACGEQVWRVDIGVAAHYGSHAPELVEIDGNRVRVLR